MLYLVDIGNEVVPFVGVFASEPTAAAITATTSTEPSLPAKAIASAIDQIALTALKSSNEPMFDPEKLLGTYQHAGAGGNGTRSGRRDAQRQMDARGFSSHGTFRRQEEP
jgi:hypothetical protein